MRIIVFLAVVFSLLIYSCDTFDSTQNEKRISQIEKYTWLVGDWQDTSNVNQWEVWRKADDSLYGFAGFIKNGDTSIFERLSIKEVDSQLVYTALIMKNKKAVSFKVTRQEEKYIVFQNPVHDFPKFISYQLFEEADGNTYIYASVFAVDRRLDYGLIKRR